MDAAGRTMRIKRPLSMRMRAVLLKSQSLAENPPTKRTCFSPDVSLVIHRKVGVEDSQISYARYSSAVSVLLARSRRWKAERKQQHPSYRSILGIHVFTNRNDLPVEPQLPKFDVARGIVIAHRTKLQILWTFVGLESHLRRFIKYFD